MSKEKNPKTGFLKETRRGTQNELEVICLILQENPALRRRVYDKIRSAKAMMGRSFSGKESK